MGETMTTRPTTDPDQTFRTSLDLSNAFAGQIQTVSGQVQGRMIGGQLGHEPGQYFSAR